MNHAITRDIVNDLWPVYEAGEASRDSRRLVESFLATDTDFAATLERGQAVAGVLPALRLSPDAERRLLDEASHRARLKLMITGAAVAFTGVIMLVALSGVLFLVLGTR